MMTLAIFPALICALQAASGLGMRWQWISAGSIADMVLRGDWVGVENAARGMHTFKHPIHVQDEFDVLTEIFVASGQRGGVGVERGLKGLAICVKHGADPN